MIDSYILEKLEFPKILQYIAKYCITENGKTKTLSIVPFDKINDAVNEGDFVTEAKNILITNNVPPLNYISNISEVIAQSRIEGVILESRKILEIFHLLVISRNLISFINSNKDTAPLLTEIVSQLYTDKLLEHNIQKIIGENGEIKDNASAKLIEIRNDIASKNNELIKSVNRIMKSLEANDIVREEYVTLRDGRIVIPIKAEHKRHIRGFIHSESSSGQTVYIEPEETLELNNELISLSFAEKREIDRLLSELTKKIGTQSFNLNNNLEIISTIDCIFAKAKYSIEVVGAFPELKSNTEFNLIEARHPILLKKFGRPGTVTLNAKLKGNLVTIITGPNAGGKTVVLKTIGLLSLMVKAGIHVPADPDSNMYFFDRVLIDIGDQQSIEDDLSTFSSHLKNIKEIISKADAKSLILLDEIGTGTDPARGAALASSVLINLKEKKAFVMASTHHGSLKIMANELEGFENAAMQFDHENLKPTYVFKQGIPGSSYAFEIAKRIGFDSNFLTLAEQYLDSGEQKLETFIEEIENKSKILEGKLKHAEIENSRLAGLTQLYQKNVAKLEKEKSEILKKAKAEAEDYLKTINKRIETVVKEIKETNADKDSIKKAHEIVKDIKREVSTIAKPEKIELVEDTDFNIGDFVNIKNTNTSGEVMDFSKDKSFAFVKVGSVSMKVKIENLIKTKKVKEKEKPTYIENKADFAPQMRLDIRGERPDEIEFDIIKFIDTAYSSGLQKIEILHGKGTGALKRLVLEILKKHEGVRTFYFAPVEFGGEGITIIELK
jgi:DNA mismatch repair protein MutS2